MCSDHQTLIRSTTVTEFRTRIEQSLAEKSQSEVRVTSIDRDDLHAEDGSCHTVPTTLAPVTAPPVSFAEATRTWMRIGLLSFGGPAGQIAVMHRILVDEKRWISEKRFLHALNYCMLLPGPEAQQLATYIGWLLHGARGGLVAGTLFILPGVITILVLSILYVFLEQNFVMKGVLLGLKAAVIALIVEALWRIGRRALPNLAARLLAAASFLALALLHTPFPLIILGAALLGYLLVRAGQRGFANLPQAPGVAAVDEPEGDAITTNMESRSSLRVTRLLALWLPLWFAPVLLCLLLLGAGHVFTQLGIFFSKMAVVTFGGAYAVLSYVSQQAVERYGWITPGQMLDGLGLAESTPGPLILVVQFVGFLAAYQVIGGDHALSAGVAGALLTVWVTFVPCFLWIFLGAPYIERLRNSAALASALAAITAAVVGVIANLGVWFTTHTLFAKVSDTGLPAMDSLRPLPAALTAIALLLMFGLRWQLGRLLLTCVALGVACSLSGA